MPFPIVYDNLGRLTEMSGTRNSSYHYDELGRLTVKHEGSHNNCWCNFSRSFVNCQSSNCCWNHSTVIGYNS
ncbi:MULTISPECIES: RHS repeat domain-containing protein [unclassified Fibrobacter]|uniref:RHS repeat domain-containing protein n=1 Tax=Fibrobacter sp. (strain UWH6) TaxID=1896212 RepID=UPI0014824EDC